MARRTSHESSSPGRRSGEQGQEVQSANSGEKGPRPRSSGEVKQSEKRVERSVSVRQIAVAPLLTASNEFGQRCAR